jgi:spermidine/putrescine transport system ATP-binding protein
MDATYSIQIHDVSKQFGQFKAVDHVSLDIKSGEFFSLLGPSGCGKTTLLRMIAGFEQPSVGQIFLDGADVTGTPPYARPVHLVFQHYALFPHLSVARNIAFGLRYQPVPKEQFASRVSEALGLVQLAGLENRHPHELSGGQKQRVALARALVLRPKVLLLDEPLGALDQKLRKEMQVELKNLQRTLGITFVFVTHDQEEAMTMSDRIAVMNGGRVEQCDASSMVFEYPRTEFVAQFMGAANFFSGLVRAVDNDHAVIVSSAGFEVKLPLRGRKVAVNSAARFMVRPEKLFLRRSRPIDNPHVAEACTECAVEQRVYQGLSTVWTVRNNLGESFMVYEQNTQPFDAAPVQTGQKMYLCWKPAHGVLIDEPVS